MMVVLWKKVKFLVKVITFLVLLRLLIVPWMRSLRLKDPSNSIIIEDEIRVIEEIQGILKETPYLWRPTNVSKNKDPPLRRISDQRKWIQQLSSSAYVLNQKRVKSIMVEGNLKDDFYTTGIVCPYAPGFEDKCHLRTKGFFERWWERNADAVVSIRNDVPRRTNKIREGMIQVMFIMEPPWIARDADLGMNNALLASYWRGSDIPIPYRIWTPHPTNDAIDIDFHALLQKKTKFAAAIVSNCESKARMEYIRALQETVQVDVFGKCGTFSCDRSRNGECLEEIGTKYKFFLSFENSKCEDYITEKVFDNALKHNIVPVVIGARPEDYEAALPLNSYIDGDKFWSPSALGAYLTHLDKDDGEYLKYLEWKQAPSSITAQAVTDFFCRLCGMLYYADFVPIPTWPSAQLEWKDVNECLPSHFHQWPIEEEKGNINPGF